MKKLISRTVILLVVATLMLTACGQTDPTAGTTQSPALSTKPGTTATPTVGTTAAPTVPTTQTPEPTTVPATLPTDPIEPETQPTEPAPTEPVQPAELPETNVYLVGDSTVCGFSDKYFYPRYGYGTQLSNYLDKKASVHNLALSGRSSKSFISEENYQTLISNLKAGDYLIISFGHNDQKSDDSARFTDATKDYTDPTSFGYYLYEYYIKLAQNVGATPILCTPIVRADSEDDYTGAEGHVTDNGDYRQAILNLGATVHVPVVDLTAITRARYEELGFTDACLYHAVIAGQYDTDGVSIVANPATIDKTHLNIYGAKYVAYRLACELKKIDSIGSYVLDEISEPTVADLEANPDYVITDYAAPDLDNYVAPSHFATISSGWYGTAFGDTGGNPQSAGNGYVAQETAEGVFQVGQSAGSNKGKFSSSSDGFAFLFRQVAADRNFSLTVTAKIIKTASTKQAGFGLMLRDDVVIDQDSANTINTNFVAAGMLANSDSEMYILFNRENTKLNKGENLVSGLYTVDDTVTFTIERIGQSVTTTVVYNGQTYTKTYYDFDFLARDTEFMYVGMFANRGTVVEYTDVVFTDLGTSQGA